MKSYSFMLVAACMFAICAPCQNANADLVPGYETLDPYTAWEVMWVREQAKVARDAYLKFYENWDQPVFASIAASEQRHMDAVLPLLEMYELGDLVEDDTRGIFGDERHTVIFEDLLHRGFPSMILAYQAAAYMEELEIDELRGAIASTTEQPLIDAYSQLLADSYNHLSVFVGDLYGFGVFYSASVLSQDELLEILADYESPLPGAITINAGLTDTWYYPANAGQGFFISVFPDRGTIALAWLTFDTELPGSEAMANLGDPGQRWLIAQGFYIDSLAVLQVYSLSGGLFGQSQPPPIRDSVGSVVLQFEDCAHGSLGYDLPSIHRTGVIPIERVAMDNVAVCEAYALPAR